MNLQKKYILAAGILVILIIGIISIILIINNSSKKSLTPNNGQPENNTISNPISSSINNIQDNLFEVINSQFNYKFSYPNNLIPHSVSPVQELSILGGDSVQIDPEQTKSYQGIQVIVQVYDRSIMQNLSLEDWIKKVSTDRQENVNNTDKKYFSSDFLRIKNGKIAFLIDYVPFLNGNNPVLLFDNGEYLYEFTKSYIDNETYFYVASSFQVKFNDHYVGITNSELNSIKSYFNKP